MIPWDTICIDLVSPYTATGQYGNGRILNAMTYLLTQSHLVLR